MAKKPPSYTPAPELPNDPEIRRRFGEIIAVLSQQQTVAGAARNLGLSRNHFQTILHRVLGAILMELTPKPAGRPAKPAREAELESEVMRLRAENESLTIRSEMIERMMNVVGGIASGRTPLPRSKGKKTKSEDPERAAALHQAVTTMRSQHAEVKLCSQLLGVSQSTVRRHSQPKAARSPRRKPVDSSACARVREIVRATHGLVGAAGLGRTCALPRRVCAEIKRRELREMELERKARCASVTVVHPGLVRGFDAMHVASNEGKAYWLVAAAAAVPYRTSIATVADYDAANVIEALRKDFDTWGPPLVLRLDRISCQRTPAVEQLLDSYGVLALYGPPRHARYYGQLERQNREHRAWYSHLEPETLCELAAAACAMRTSLNALWPRPTLNGCTAEQAWLQRQAVVIDRRELRHEVERQAAGLVSSGLELLRARRIAIESALTRRGVLTVNQGGWC